MTPQVRISQLNIEGMRRDDKSEYQSTIASEIEIDIITLQETFLCYLIKCSFDVS